MSPLVRSRRPLAVAAETPNAVDRFDALAEPMRVDWEVPGLAVALVVDAAVVAVEVDGRRFARRAQEEKGAAAAGGG